jgi:hypothetical protein
VILRSFSDPTRWAEQQWSTAALGDARRTRRAVQLGAALAACPEENLPQQTGSWGGLKSAYRLLHEPDVTHAALSEPHWQATRQQAARADTVLFVQDTSELDFTAHRQTRGLGWIGNTGGCGFFLHSCLAVRPTAVPEILGLAAQQVWTRHEVKKGTETRAARAKRRKESDVWAEVVEAIGPAAPEQCWVSVSDRASDVFSFVRRARAQGWHCLWRVGQNRVVLAGSGRKTKLLLDWARRLPAQTETTIDLRGRAAQPPRTVRLQVAWSEGDLMSALQRAGAPAGTRIRVGCAVLGSQQTEECVGMDFVYHCSRHRCGFGLGADRVVPAALGGGGVSQSIENGMRHGAAAVT